MASQVQIVNAALRMIGANRITALDGSTKEAREAEDAWDAVVDAAFAAYPWNFAIKYDDVAAEADAPVHTWDTSYPVPADCLRVLDCPDLHTTEWTMGQAIASEGRAVLANTTGALNIKYICRVEDTSQWDPCFGPYVSARLAWTLCETITESGSLKERISVELKAAMTEARQTDAIEGPPEDLPVDDWLVARL